MYPFSPCFRVQSAPHRGWRGFTLIELLVVLAIVSMLLTLAAPRYFKGLENAKDAVLIENLRLTRDTLDKFYSDVGRYPESLDELVDKMYLKNLPVDPITNSVNTWVVVAPKEGQRGKVADIHSGARGKDRWGRDYSAL